jgi:hypothetical protein
MAVGIVVVLIVAVLILAGLAAAGWGLVNALRAPRPRSLAGALVGGAGLALALLGATRLAAPGFF